MKPMNADLRYDALRFVLQRGDDVTKLYLLQLLDLMETKMAKDILLNLLKSQMTSGGFPSAFDAGKEGVRETCRNAFLLMSCGMPSDGLNVMAAVEYLLDEQRGTGGWSENPDLIIPKGVMELSTGKGITWLTTDIVRLLRMVGLGEKDPCTRALNWLREMQNQDGGWSMFKNDGFRGSDPDSSAQILFMMREIYSEDAPVWVKGVELFEKSLNKVALDAERGYYHDPSGKRRDLDIYHLTHVLLSSLVDSNGRIEAGYDLGDPRVKKIVDAIVRTQHEDGGWKPFWTEESDPTYTVLALKLLVWLGVPDLSELRERMNELLRSS
jgi:hypothetical protein